MATVATKHRKLSAQKEKKKHTHIEAANKHGRQTHWNTNTHTQTLAHTRSCPCWKACKIVRFLRRRTNDVEWRDLASARGKGGRGALHVRTCGVVCVVAIYVQGACHENELRFGQFCAAVRNVLPLNFMCKCSSNLSPKNTQTNTHTHTRACKNTHTHTVGQAETYFYDTPKGNWQCPAGQQPGRQCQLMSVSSLLDN